MRALRKWILLALFAFAPLPAFGQQCGGFTDVDPADFYCNNVEWMKNRAVTLGCTATLYCDNDFVLRSQMAAFMNRLGNVLTPVILRATDSAAGQTYALPFILCESTATPVAAAAYPRQASFTATVMNFNANATKTMQGRLMYSTNVGASWVPTGDSVMWQTVDPGERSTLALTGGPLDLVAGETYLFALELTTNAVAATVDAECQLNVRIDNRNGTSTPF